MDRVIVWTTLTGDIGPDDVEIPLAESFDRDAVIEIDDEIIWMSDPVRRGQAATAPARHQAGAVAHVIGVAEREWLTR